jgi:hypothetical protein
VTDRRLLVWRRPASFSAEARIEALALGDIEGVELVQDDWDRKAGTHRFIVHEPPNTRELGRVHNAERLRDAATDAGRVTPPPAPTSTAEPAPPPGDFLPPPPAPADYRP